MGLSASQGRMLSLTSRLSDLEYRAQAIQNQKIRLADQSEAVSKDYLDALNAKKLTAYNADTNTQVDATLLSLYTLNASSSNGTKRVIVDSEGNVVVPSDWYKDKDSLQPGKDIKAVYYTKDTVTEQIDDPEHPGEKKSVTREKSVPHAYTPQGYVSCPADKATDTSYLYKQLESGNWFIVEYQEHEGSDELGAWERISYSSGDAKLMTKSDDFELARVEAEYETAMNEIQNKDKRFDLELQTIDTEHKAIQTEMDSVSKVMDKNIDRTFKIFG